MNRPSRKPFSWGGLAGYQQLSAIADVIRQLVDETPETDYLRCLLSQVARALENYRALAQDLEAAHDWLRRIAAVLQYRLSAEQNPSEPINSDSVAKAMEQLIVEFQPDFKRQPAQRALYHALSRTWDAFGPDLLHCYDIEGLPPDNLALNSCQIENDGFVGHATSATSTANQRVQRCRSRPAGSRTYENRRSTKTAGLELIAV